MEETPWERVHTTPEVEPIAEVGEICTTQVMHLLGFRETLLKRATTNGRATQQCMIQRNLMLGIMYHCKFICRIWKCKSFPFKTKNLLLTPLLLTSLSTRLPFKLYLPQLVGFVIPPLSGLSGLSCAPHCSDVNSSCQSHRLLPSCQLQWILSSPFLF